MLVQVEGRKCKRQRQQDELGKRMVEPGCRRPQHAPPRRPCRSGSACGSQARCKGCGIGHCQAISPVPTLPQTYADGRPAPYGFGLAHETIGDAVISGHGGALRGFRCRRLYAPAERLSVVVMFNHEGDAHAAAVALMKIALGHEDNETTSGSWDAKGTGNYLDAETGLALVTRPSGSSRVELQFATSPESLSVSADGSARSAAVTLTAQGASLRMERPRENLTVSADRVSGTALPDIAGRYHSVELDAHLDIASTNGVFYGGFDGSLGTGAMHAMRPLAEDVWLLRCKRSMDAPAPGDWTVLVRRDQQGNVAGLTIGCWLARRIDYTKIG